MSEPRKSILNPEHHQKSTLNLESQFKVKSKSIENLENQPKMKSKPKQSIQKQLMAIFHPPPPAPGFNYNALCRQTYLRVRCEEKQQFCRINQHLFRKRSSVLNGHVTTRMLEHFSVMKAYSFLWYCSDRFFGRPFTGKVTASASKSTSMATQFPCLLNPGLWKLVRDANIVVLNAVERAIA